MPHTPDHHNGSRVPILILIYALASMSTILLTISDTTHPDTTATPPPPSSLWHTLYHHHNNNKHPLSSKDIHPPISPPPPSFQDLGQDILSKVIQSQDSLSLIAAANLCISLWLLLALATKSIFLGLQPISLIESATLADRLLKFIMVKVVFLATMPDPAAAAAAAVNAPLPHINSIIDWAIWLAVFGFFHLFICLAVARCDTTSQPHQHIRCLILIMGILVQDVGWMVAYVKNMGDTPMTMVLLWLFDAVVVAVEAVHALVRYAVQSSLHSSTSNGGGSSRKWILAVRHSGDDEDRSEEEESNDDDSDDNTSVILFHLELSVDLLLGLLTLLHYGHLWWLHGLRCQLIDAVLFLDVRFLGGNIYNRIKGYYKYRKLTRQLQDGLPTATPEQLGGKICSNGNVDSDGIAVNGTSCINGYSCNAECAVCMCINNTKSKVLPCGHIFHLNCVRGWLQQSKSGKFTCPLCRQSLPTDLHSNIKKKKVARKRNSNGKIHGPPPNAHRVLDLHKEEEGEEEEDPVMPHHHHYNSSLNSDGDEDSSSSTIFGMMVANDDDNNNGDDDTIMSTPITTTSHRYNTRFRFHRLRTGRV